MLLILAAVSLSAVFSDKGIFSRAESAGVKYNEAKAREVLETVLLADGQYEKNINPKYNQDDFLDELIISEIPGSRIQGDVAIIGEWAFELDRSVPKIGRGLGKADKLVFPTVEIISGPTLIENGKKATFEAKVTETTKGISRIELWLDGKKIDKETKTYETLKKEITVTFEVNKNGKYTVKAYADLMGSNKATVTGIVPAVSFSPNGSEEWKKQHTTKVTVEETTETITGMQYLWVKDDGVNEPEVALFTQNCPSDGIITGGNDTMTGIYYLWVLLTIGTGKTQRTSMYASQGFNFDNEAPKINLNSSPNTETTFTMNSDVIETKSGIAGYEFWVDGKKVGEFDTQEPNKVYNHNMLKMFIGTASVYVRDKAGNVGKADTDVRTLAYMWLRSGVQYKYSSEVGSLYNTGNYTMKSGSRSYYSIYSIPSDIFNESTGQLKTLPNPITVNYNGYAGLNKTTYQWGKDKSVSTGYYLWKTTYSKYNRRLVEWCNM